MNLSKFTSGIYYFLFAYNFCFGSETSLRQNIDKLLKGKLKFDNGDLPFDKNELMDSTPKNHSEYDFIIIGAGTAGSTLASRLTEIENVTVLLIEAGGKEYSIIDVPGLAVPLQLSDEINWNYHTESSDRYCLGLKDHKCRWPRGKVMGGSSSINYMLGTRGSRRDYDSWADVTGDDTWSYENMLRYFKKLENFNGRNLVVDYEYHSINGPLPISGPQQKTKLTDAFIQAGKELGYSEVDYNGARQTGFSFYQSAIHEGERWSNNRAYLRPAKCRKNLLLTQHSHVHKVLISNSTKSAYGVRYSKNKTIYEVNARREVILCAGAINSPQILMLSGVGPSKHLNDLKIDVVKDSPVGENLIDHVGYVGLTFKTNDSSEYSGMSLMDPKNPAIKNYLESRTGPLASGLNFGGMAYVNVDDDKDSDPNLELLFNSFSGLKNQMFASALGVSEDYKERLFADLPNNSVWMMWPMLTKPRSRGKILLRSDDPFDKPKIYPNYLDDYRDVEVLIKGIRMTIKLSKTRALQRYGSELLEIPLPCGNHEDDSDDYWECAVRTWTTTVYHPVGTCKMGKTVDDTSVVDSRLKVIGVKGPRVVDASVMPDIPSGHTNLPVTAIAENAADMIKEDYSFFFK